ncbi:MAG: hypothetical protein ABEJ35_01215 [Halobacteriaceae archaeon]
MWITKLPWVFIGGLGLGLAMGTGYLILRGPFFGAPLLEPLALMVAVGGFFAGVFLFSFAAARFVNVGMRM